MPEDDTQTYTTNQDGSISIKNADGKTVKYVPESDLGAVKVQLKDKESEVTKLQTSLADANSKYEASHQEVLQERAAKELLEKDAKEGVTTKEKLTKAEQDLADLTKVSGETLTKLTERVRTYLQTNYKIDEEKLKDKALADLETIESTLQLTGAVPAPANYDGKGGDGGAGDLTGKSPLALATLGYERSKK